MNPLYQMLNPGQMASQTIPQTPLSRMAVVMQAMRNPAAFVKQQFPDIPDEMMNDPQRILGYLQQSRGIGNEQINQIVNLYNGRMEG